MIARLRPEARYKDILFSFFDPERNRAVLEDALADFFKVRKVILTQSARGGLYFLFRSLPHKTVLIPSYTCWVVVEAARLAGKEVEFIDIRLADYNLDTEVLHRKIRPNSIILATHQFGIPCDIEEILQIAEANQCYVIEDNAAAIGSEYKGKRTGSFAGASVISFEFTKTLTCGRGGAMLFNDTGLYEQTKALFEKEVVQESLFFTLKYFAFLFFAKLLTQRSFYKIINLIFLKAKGLTSAVPAYEQAPDLLYTNKLSGSFIRLANSNLSRMKRIMEDRKNISSLYSESLSGSNAVEVPSYGKDKIPVFMRYPVRVKGRTKEEFYALLSKQGVDLAFTFPYSCDPDKNNSPNSFTAASSVVNLPAYSSLSKNDISEIINSIKDI